MTVETFTPSPPINPVDLAQFATDASAVHKIATGIANTNFVPVTMQGRPDEITAAILFGRALGMDPMVSLQTIHVIEKRPSVSANAMRGLAQAGGVKFRLDDSNDTRVVMSASAPGDKAWTTVTWTMDRADKMGLTGKPNWKKMPQAMLVARATSELCRLVAANILIGLPYSVEELQDLPHEDARNANGTEKPAPKMKAAAPTPETRTVKRDPIKAHVEPGNVINQLAVEQYDQRDVPQRPVGEVVVRENSITTPTRTAVMATFNDLGVKLRNERMAKVQEIVEREVYSVNQLTEDEGHKILTVLTAGKTWDEEAPA